MSFFGLFGGDKENEKDSGGDLWGSISGRAKQGALAGTAVMPLGGTLGGLIGGGLFGAAEHLLGLGGLAPEGDPASKNAPERKIDPTVGLGLGEKAPGAGDPTYRDVTGSGVGERNYKAAMEKYYAELDRRHKLGFKGTGNEPMKKPERSDFGL